MLGSKLRFHSHVDYVYSQALRTLGLIRHIKHNVPSLGSLIVLYNALSSSKLKYSSVVWNNLALTDSNLTYKIEIVGMGMSRERKNQFASLGLEIRKRF
jgi:hypothetical protein